MADRRLQVFHAVAKHRSFTKAAEALFMTNALPLNRGLELLAAESVTRHTLFRYDRKSGEWAMEKAPVYHIVD